MLSVIELIRAIESGALSPGAVIDRCAEAIAAREAAIGAFTCLDIGAARAAAATAKGPLAGIPVGVKDIFDTADFPTEFGSPIYAGHHSRGDASLVALMRRAGCTVLGKTVTTEFAYFTPRGTRNPHNPGHTPGGSSSGSAAAVAAGMVPLATGSQTGGSIIRPAAYCSVAGFKPSFRLLPTVGMKPFSWSLDTAGLFAASVADVAYAMAAISGRDLRVDHQVFDAPTIAVLDMHHWTEASDAMKDAVSRAARAAEAAGATVTTLRLPDAVADLAGTQQAIQNHEAAQALAYEYDTHRDQLSDTLRALIEKGMAITPDGYDSARRKAQHARRAFAALEGADIILAPSATGIAPEGLSSTGSPVFNWLWTLLGTPCVNVPGLADSNGMPLGVQVIARFGRDHTALQAGHFLEHAIRRSA